MHGTRQAQCRARVEVVRFKNLSSFLKMIDLVTRRLRQESFLEEDRLD